MNDAYEQDVEGRLRWWITLSLWIVALIAVYLLVHAVGTFALYSLHVLEAL